MDTVLFRKGIGPRAGRRDGRGGRRGEGSNLIPAGVKDASAKKCGAKGPREAAQCYTDRTCPKCVTG